MHRQAKKTQVTFAHVGMIEKQLNGLILNNDADTFFTKKGGLFAIPAAFSSVDKNLAKSLPKCHDPYNLTTPSCVAYWIYIRHYCTSTR